MNNTFDIHQPNHMDLGIIQGRVIDKQGLPIEEAVVMIIGESPTHPDIAALTNENGEYRYTNLLPGNYTLLVNALDRDLVQSSVEVMPGEASLLNFEID